MGDRARPLLMATARGSRVGEVEDATMSVPPVPVPSPASERKAETVARAILHHISGNGLPPGTTLPSEAAMVAQYKVSRATIREALRILEFNGLLTMRRGPEGGPVTVRAEPRELGRVMTLHFQAAGAHYEDLVQARADLEPIMARLAAASDDPALRGEIEGILRRTEVSTDHGENVEFGC